MRCTDSEMGSWNAFVHSLHWNQYLVKHSTCCAKRKGVWLHVKHHLHRSFNMFNFTTCCAELDKEPALSRDLLQMALRFYGNTALQLCRRHDHQWTRELWSHLDHAWRAQGGSTFWWAVHNAPLSTQVLKLISKLHSLSLGNCDVCLKWRWEKPDSHRRI